MFPDGSGWMKVKSGTETGLVPASYLEVLPSTSTLTAPTRPESAYSNHSSVASLSSSMHASSANPAASGKRKGPAVAPKRGAKKLNYVEAMYDYEARTDLEHDMKEGERFVLVNMDNGDGWAEVEKGGVRKSVPANYIQEV